MVYRIAAWTLPLGLLATAAWAQPATPSGDESTRSMPEVRGRLGRVNGRGHLTRIDQNAQVLGFEDGRLVRVTPTTTIFVDNQPVSIRDLRPGQSVVIRSGQAVAVRDGRVVAEQDTAGVAGVGVPSGGAGELRHTIVGRVRDIDRDGTVQIEAGEDAFGKDSLKVRMSPDQARQLRKGDTVQIDLTLGAPAASPRTR